MFRYFCNFLILIICNLIPLSALCGLAVATLPRDSTLGLAYLLAAGKVRLHSRAVSCLWFHSDCVQTHLLTILVCIIIISLVFLNGVNLKNFFYLNHNFFPFSFAL